MTAQLAQAMLEIQDPEGNFTDAIIESDVVVIGRDPACDVVLRESSVSRRHASIELHPDGYLLSDLASTQGTFVNGQRISTVVLSAGDRIMVGDCKLRFIETRGDIYKERSNVSAVPKPMPACAPVAEKAAPASAMPAPKQKADAYPRLVDKVHRLLIEENRKRQAQQGGRAAAVGDVLEENAERLANAIVFDLRKRKDDDLVAVLGAEGDSGLARLVSDVLDAALRYGPLQPYIDDPSIEEIMVNGPSAVFVKRRGVQDLERTPAYFLDEKKLRNLVDSIVRPLNREINERRPMIDGRLPDGSRINAIIPPLSRIGPVLTIRKFPDSPYDAAHLEASGTFDKPIRVFLELAVRHGQNIVISGGTASGKTTLLNAVSAFVPSASRIITIEDSAELRLQQPHVVSLETRLASLEEENPGESNTLVTIRDLVRNALRMRPDRIIVGECRGGEAMDMLQAMNTGHMGSMTTGHANGAREMLARLETMCLTAGIDIPIMAIREQISRAINLIVHVEQCPDGQRRITEVLEVEGLDGSEYIAHPIYRFDSCGDRFVPCGRVPAFVRRLYAKGVEVPPVIFGSHNPTPKGTK